MFNIAGLTSVTARIALFTMKYRTFLFLGFICSYFQANCYQNWYKLVPDHCEVVNHNKSFFEKFNGKCVKRSRTLLLLNISMIFTVDVLTNHDVQALVTGYQFRSNEFRKGPIEFMVGACSWFASKDFDIPNMLKESNVGCPFRKGHFYYIYNLNPNATNLPPLLPGGKWRLDVQFLYKNQYPMFTTIWYTDIEYDVMHHRY